MGRLFWKIFAGIWISLVLTMLGVGTAFFLHTRAHMDENSRVAKDPRSAFSSRLAAVSLEHGGEEVARNILLDWPSRELTAPMVVNPEGRDLLDRPVNPEMLNQAREHLDASMGGRGPLAATSPSGIRYIVFLPASDSGIREPRLEMEYPAALFIAALVASLIVSAMLARHFSLPINQLRNALESVAAGRLDTRVDESMKSRRDELGDLGRDFDSMAQQLGQLMNTRDRLLHDISHELRSPLARLQAAVGLAHQQPQRLEAALERIEREIERLDALVGEVLTLARLEAPGVDTPDGEFIELHELIATVVDDARFESESSEKKIDLLDRIDEEIVMAARGSLLHRAIDNVTRNALRYTPDGGTVEVELDRTPDSGDLRITIRDQGPGVAAEQLQSIFEPFVRADDNGNGYGLGLAIARRAVEAHGGRIKAMNRLSGGLEVSIILPARLRKA